MNNIELKYLYFLPEKGNTFAQLLADCFIQLTEYELYKNNFCKKIVRLTIFVAADTCEEYKALKIIVDDYLHNFFETVPPTAIVAQSPENATVSLEIQYLEGIICNNIRLKKQNDLTWVVYEEPDFKMLFASGLSDTISTNNILEKCTRVFEKLNTILQIEKMKFSDIVRQWNYIEQITAAHTHNHIMSQHYQIFNDVRSKYYRQADFATGYPAATGIGVQSGGIIVDFIAFQTNRNESIIPLKSVLQLDAHRYTPKVLADNFTNCDLCRTTPKFERAKLVRIGTGNLFFVSGTAAIKGQDSLTFQTVEEQTHTTIDSILNLLSVENLLKHKIPCSNQLLFKYLRVYVKYGADIQRVKAICEARFLNISLIYTVADVCRPELLVEIEGEAFMQD